MIYKIPYLALLFLLGCAQVTSLNLKKHQFGQLPTKIVWLQVAGLSEEHIAILKFSRQNAEVITAFEDFLCIGKAWDYNLFDIRPSAYSAFQSQITGKKNIKNQCEDYSLTPIWGYMQKQGYKAGVLEGEMSKDNSLIAAKQCGEVGSKYLDGLTLWKMSKRTNEKDKLFHINERVDFSESEIYYDKSCLTGDCYSTFSQNTIKVFEQFTRKSSNYVYIIRDFYFNQQMEKKNLKNVKSDLIELEKIVVYFQDLAIKSNDVLFILTSAETKNVEFPRSGKEWEKFEESGDYITNKKSQLISTVFATGARAENFCGIYDQSNILSRIFSGAKQQGLELAIINPFQQ